MPFVETRSSCHVVCLSSDPPIARPEDKSITKWQSTRLSFVVMTVPKRSPKSDHSNATGCPGAARRSCGVCKTRLQIETVRTSRRFVWTGPRILVRL